MIAKEYKIIYEEIQGVSRYWIYYYEDGINVSKEFLGSNPSNFLPIREDYIKQLDTSNIVEYKQYLCDKLDEKTQSTIAEGFIFDGIVFSLSAHAQTNITNLPNAKDEKFPMPYLGKEDEIYILTLADKMDFYYTAFDTIVNIRIANGALKVQLKTLTTTEELDLFRHQNNL